MSQSSFALRGRNPDILTCIANLSNDEVFTPPELANQMLDSLAAGWAASHGGANIWADKTVKFLDPFTKTGVFLREITGRLTRGLEEEMPDLNERVNHILSNQVYGIAITQITSLLARRSLYCSKHAKGRHSIIRSFESDNGNIWYQGADHNWRGAKCTECGASEATYSRDEKLERHAYTLLHTSNVKETLRKIFGGEMNFDVVIGNPPYQLDDGGFGASATPIYHKFVEQAIAIEPRFLCMVIPSRWFVGGKGLDNFRSSMLNSKHLRSIVDYIVEKDAFPGINLNGGVNYFLWEHDYVGDCAVTTIERGGVVGEVVLRSLSEYDVFIRRNEALPILRKIRKLGEPTFERHVSPRKPFGLPTNFFGAKASSKSKDIKLHSSGGETWVARAEILAKAEWIDEWKVLVGRATDGNESYPLPIWDKRGPFTAGPGEACSETYLVAAVANSHGEASRISTYMRTKFFRFLVSLRKVTQDNKADVFAFVPDLPMDREWTDALLYKRYGITKAEIAFIDSMIRSMDGTDTVNDG
jgi:hypothetical protein